MRAGATERRLAGRHTQTPHALPLWETFQVEIERYPIRYLVVRAAKSSAVRFVRGCGAAGLLVG